MSLTTLNVHDVVSVDIERTRYGTHLVTFKLNHPDGRLTEVSVWSDEKLEIHVPDAERIVNE